MLQGVSTISLPDVALSLEACGRGSALVLVHGFGGDRSTWDGAWKALGRDRRLLRYDLRGFGQSIERDDQTFSHARDLEALLDAMGIRRCDLVGVSMGGAVALNFALDRPARVRRLVLVSPGLVAWDWSEDWRALWRPIVEAAVSGDLAQARELWWTHPLFETTRSTPAAAELLRKSILSYSGRHWVEGDRQEPALPDLDRLHLLAAPTLLLTGSRDLDDFRLIAGLIEAAAPDLRRKDYAGAGHLLHLEQPKAFNRDVLAFLGESPTSAP